MLQNVTAQQLSVECNPNVVHNVCTHYDFYSTHREPFCCPYEPSVCCYRVPTVILLSLFAGCGLAIVFLFGWISTCCANCCARRQTK
ncbi:unnamed protein product [Bursaphelenchus okinawaensis]|uniref:Uncharacterized protein n=1 Tax=Bursaphelenchus okinawaensis TaxID=465554 RepID=A0A811LIF9_9BILA|nr:unnamed protein product [Bursaphelenchus okinawaensis]CAG9123829.1 unnamed protein product [Bursaphelenchus okinawaensis]